jgi:hypothetical protein
MKPLTKTTLGSFLAIGVVVALLAGGPDLREMFWPSDSAPPAMTENSTAVARFYPTGTPRKITVFYVVDSDELSAAVRDAEARTLSDLIAAGDEFPPRSYGIYKLQTPEDEVSFNRMVSDTIGDLSGAGLADVLVIDLRSN